MNAGITSVPQLVDAVTRLDCIKRWLTIEWRNGITLNYSLGPAERAYWCGIYESVSGRLVWYIGKDSPRDPISSAFKIYSDVVRLAAFITDAS